MISITENRKSLTLWNDYVSKANLLENLIYPIIYYLQRSPGWPETHYIAQVGLKLAILLLSLPCIGITSAYHHAHLYLHFKYTCTMVFTKLTSQVRIACFFFLFNNLCLILNVPSVKEPSFTNETAMLGKKKPQIKSTPLYNHFRNRNLMLHYRGSWFVLSQLHYVILLHTQGSYSTLTKTVIQSFTAALNFTFPWQALSHLRSHVTGSHFNAILFDP
jgi:hypothetical protein